ENRLGVEFLHLRATATYGIETALNRILDHLDLATALRILAPIHLSNLHLGHHFPSPGRKDNTTSKMPNCSVISGEQRSGRALTGWLGGGVALVQEPQTQTRAEQ